MAVSLSSTFHGSWAKSFAPCEERAMLAAFAPSSRIRLARPVRSSPKMGNVNEGKGLFAPIVVSVRNIVGRKRFNQLRGKAIALHSQKEEFRSYLGAVFSINSARRRKIRLRTVPRALPDLSYLDLAIICDYRVLQNYWS